MHVNQFIVADPTMFLSSMGVKDITPWASGPTTELLRTESYQGHAVVVGWGASDGCINLPKVTPHLVPMSPRAWVSVISLL